MLCHVASLSAVKAQLRAKEKEEEHQIRCRPASLVL